MRRGLLSVGLLALLQGSGSGCSRGSEPFEGEPVSPKGVATVQAVVTLPPLAWFVERLAGDGVQVEVLIPPEADHHTFEPAPRAAMALARASLVVQVGHPALPFEKRFVEQVRRQNPEARVVTLASAEQAAGDDPHLWVDPETVRPLVAGIAQALTELDPAGAPRYAARREDLEAELEELDAELRSILAGAPGRAFLVHHPTWGGLARRYGLQQMVLEKEGKEPGPRRLAQLLEEARDRRVEVVLVQRGFSDKAARAVAREIGARVVEADPLSRDWPASLRQAASALAAPTPENGLRSPVELER